jgi:cytochrome c peroxidase
MRARVAIAGLAALAIAGGAALVAKSEPQVEFSKVERAAILAHGPWPQPRTLDLSNRVSGNPTAIALGKQLFADPRLSRDGRRSCATCHDPARFFADGRDRSVGLARVDRNAIALANLRLNRWFGWAGAADSLWAQSIRPMLDEKELGRRPTSCASGWPPMQPSPRSTHACSALRSRRTRQRPCSSMWPRRSQPSRRP